MIIVAKQNKIIIVKEIEIYLKMGTVFLSQYLYKIEIIFELLFDVVSACKAHLLFN